MSSSPPIARAIAVLNFLGGHAGQAFTLTEIAKSLRISSATCHNLLGALTDAGYVYRTAAKTYVLGPAISRLSQESLSLDILMQVVRPEMRLLADEFDLVCSASFLMGDEVIVHARAAAVSHIAWNAPELAPQKAIAPFGGVFLAWSGSEAIGQWLDQAMPVLGPDEREDILRTLETLRASGYTFGVRMVPLDGPEQALALRNRRDLTSYSAPAVNPMADYHLAFISAPVFSQAHQVAFSVNLLGFSHPAKGKAVAAMGERLRAACDRIGAFIAGRAILGPGQPVSRR